MQQKKYIKEWHECKSTNELQSNIFKCPPLATKTFLDFLFHSREKFCTTMVLYLMCIALLRLKSSA